MLQFIGGMGGAEIFIIFLVALLLFGSKKIPELAKGLGKGINEFKKATNSIKKELNDSDVKEISKDIKDIKGKLKQ
ncbi:MAG: Sec-independent protein translocase TatA [Bacteroidetes bacterium 4572_128]|nr:MAG: Sec-independent protein translocase TatA [Bacteroidetes bacterium 4572_128]